MTGEHPEKSSELEHRIDGLLRAQPPLRAPPGLQARVWAQLERAGLPWWRRPFVHWPVSARCAFVLTATAFAVLATRLMSWFAVRTETSIESEVAWLYRMERAAVEIGELHALLIHSIPLSWLGGGLLLIALLYATLFGLGAAAYRLLYRQG